MANDERPKLDFRQGIPVAALRDRDMVLGRVDDDDVLLARAGGEIFAVGAHCTHYHGPLADGILVDDTVRCPWHHACFSLRTGEAVRAPALDPIACWSIELSDNKVFVRENVATTPIIRVAHVREAPRKIVIIGGGAAGFAAAEMLR